MSGVEVKIISESDASIYSRSAQSRIVNAPSSPPLTSKAIQVASGRRKGFQSKNDSAVEKIAEKKVSARMPRFEDGELKDYTTKLEPVIISSESKQPSSRRKEPAKSTPTLATAEGMTVASEEAQLNPKIQAVFGDHLTRLNVSPPMIRKKESNPKLAPKVDERPQPTFGSPRQASPRDDVEIINSGTSSPPAGRRSPPTSAQGLKKKPAPIKAAKSRDDDPPEDPTSGQNSNRRPTSKTSKIRQPLSNPAEVVGIRVKDINPDVQDPTSGIRLRSNPKSNDRQQYNSGPHSPQKIKNNVKVKGKKVIAKESSESASGASTTSGTTTSIEVTSRRKIKSRKEALDKKISENFDEGEFYPEDDEHLKFAVRAALEESRKESVKEALAAGHDLNAKILESVTRPNSVEEVIEKMVSQRRERIQESQRRHHKPKSSEKPKPFQPRRGKPQQPPPEMPRVPSSSEDDDPDIETIEEPRDRASTSPPEQKNRLPDRPRVAVDAGFPKQTLPGSPIAVATDISKQEAEEPSSPEPEREVNVRLPPENRKAKKGDYLEPADALGQRDFVYDPLGVDKPFGDEDDNVGDDVYEESSEDESKLTINEKKDEMLYRFKLIKEAYPGIALPRITKQMKLAKMVRHYEHVMSRVKLKIKTGNYKIFLIGAFLFMQFAIKKLGMDASGFVQNQMLSMKRYEPYLREFGESDFSAIGADLPLIIRLPFFMVVNMGIFLIAKMIFKATGKDVTDQFYKLYAQLTGGDDYVYIKEGEGGNGLAAGAGEDDGGGLFGMIKTFLGMMGGGGGGGVSDDAPKRGEATGPTFRRRRRE